MLFILLLFSLLSCEAWELWALGAAVLSHELGHLAALRFWGKSPCRLHPGFDGAVIECSPFSSPQEEAVAALSGSIAGLIWAFLLFHIPLPHASYAAEVSAVLSLFNLLPVPRLDGGRVFLALGVSRTALRLCALLCLAPLLLICLSRKLWVSCATLLWLWICTLRED